MKSSDSNEESTFNTMSTGNLNLRHLQAEIARIDAMIQREIYCWQLAGQDPSDPFRGLYVSDQDANTMMARPIFTNWGNTATPDPEVLRSFEEAIHQAELNARAISNAAKAQGHTLRLNHLAEVFNLTRFEVDTLLVCLAPALDLRYERIYGYLQDNLTLKNPGVSLVLDLLCESGSKRIEQIASFNDAAALFRHHLVCYTPESQTDHVPLLRRMVTLDSTISAWLCGDYLPNPMINAHTHLYPIPTAYDPALFPGEKDAQISNSLKENSLLVFSGPDTLRQEAAAVFTAKISKRPLLMVNLSAISNEGHHPLEAIRLAFRDARLLKAIPQLTGWDCCVSNHGVPQDLLAELYSYPDLAIVSGNTPWIPGGISRDRVITWIDFQIPDYPHRLALWHAFLEQVEPGENYDLSLVAGQFQLTAGQIRDAVASARDLRAEKGGALQEEDLYYAARVHSNPNLSGLARKLTPRYGWADIVLPDDQVALLREIVATVRCRPRVLDEWGVGDKLASSRGVTALFSGPPGTGKTMAAEILAAELNLDLYKIDLSTVVSKYIGETEKNLERIFKEAETSNAILFFDEADALFGKRSEVRDSHDRYANIEISFLLQRMEAYNGVTILATNLRANLDEAFTRRLQFAVDFPFPDEQDRLRIWQTLFPPKIPQKSELDLKFLAGKFRLAGGNIRNIIVNAAYLAADDGQTITMEHLLHGTRRELQKMGRLVDENEMASR